VAGCLAHAAQPTQAFGRAASFALYGPGSADASMVTDPPPCTRPV
jgi:hypothetical protein